MIASLPQIAQKLKEHQAIFILCHQNPDGDTLGSGFALSNALRQMGKQTKVLCSDEVPKKFAYLTEEYTEQDFEPDLVVSVDVADPQLLGKKLEAYKAGVDICIDHHKINKMTAALSFIEETAAAACEIMVALLKELPVRFTKQIADCLYTGLCTDTGCFKFSNTTPRTHRLAAEMMEYGCDYERINRELFDTKTRGRIQVERAVLDSMEFYCGGQVALIVISQALLQSSGMDSSELDGVSAIPRQIEGVEVGVTMRERPEGGYKVSLRTCQSVDAAMVCAALGGGGHARAAGCAINRDLETAKQLLLEQIAPILE